MRKTVTISYSCKPETWKKIQELRDALEAERMETVNLSALIDRLITLGFAYREQLFEKQKQTKLDIGQTELEKEI